MSLMELMTVTAWFVFVLVSATSIGVTTIFCLEKVFRLKNQKIDTSKVGSGLIVGMQVLGLTALILGLLGIFTKPVLIVVFLVLTTIGLLHLLPQFSRLNWNILLRLTKSGILEHRAAFLVSMLTLGILSTIYLAAMQPPHTSDELNYHFPQAVDIVKNQRVDPLFGGHYFYGAIPKQMEILQAVGIALSSYQLAHAIHFAYLCGFILILGGIVYKLYGPFAASLSIAFLLLYGDLIWNMTSGFVDGASFVAEVGALLLALSWLNEKKQKWILIACSLLLGSALSIKYSALVTAVFIFLVLSQYLKRIWQYLVLPGFIVGGYWYIKNLILFQNPFYPLYLGHKGVEEDEYLRLIANIQEFTSRDLGGFIEKMKYFTEISRLPILFALVLLPLIFLVQKNRRFIVTLLAFVVLYIPYWFFLGTHQLRFLGPAVIVSLILLGITVSKVKAIYLATFLVIVTTVMFTTPYFDQSVGSYFWSTKFHLRERQYALGNISQDEFMKRWYGCYYTAVIHAESLEPGFVIDNWSQGYEFNLPFYAQVQKWISTASVEFDTHDTPAYYYVREDTRDNQRRTSVMDQSIIVKFDKFEKKVINDNQKIWQEEDCSIYLIEDF